MRAVGSTYSTTSYCNSCLTQASSAPSEQGEASIGRTKTAKLYRTVPCIFRHRGHLFSCGKTPSPGPLLLSLAEPWDEAFITVLSDTIPSCARHKIGAWESPVSRHSYGALPSDVHLVRSAVQPRSARGGHSPYAPCSNDSEAKGIRTPRTPREAEHLRFLRWLIVSGRKGILFHSPSRVRNLQWMCVGECRMAAKTDLHNILTTREHPMAFM